MQPWVNTSVHFVDQKMNVMSPDNFNSGGYFSAKEFYVKSIEEAAQFSYKYYMGRQMVSSKFPLFI